MQKLPYADTVPYFKTGRTTADVWIEKAITEIKRAKGHIERHGYGSDLVSGRAAFMIAFRIEEDHFRITWPVLPVKKPPKDGTEDPAAKIQAATFLYHDVKAKCMKAVVFGARTAFFEHLLLSDGREAHQAATPDLIKLLPESMQPQNQPKLLTLESSS